MMAKKNTIVQHFSLKKEQSTQKYNYRSVHSILTPPPPDHDVALMSLIFGERIIYSHLENVAKCYH